MKVLVTGATGFIGRHLTRALAGAGHVVVGLSRDPEAARRQVPELAAAHAWRDPQREPPPAEAFAGVEGVVHLLGEPVNGRWTARKKQAIRESRVASTRGLVAAIAALAARPRVLVSASAVGYYGDRGEEPLDERAASGGDFLAEVCVAWEAAAREAEALSLRVVLLRTGLVLGRGGGALDAMLLPFKLCLGGPLGSGRQWWPWIHLEDELALVRLALERQDLAGPLNAVAPEGARQRDFARALGRALARPAFMPAPRLLLRLVLGEFACELVSSRRALPAAATAAGFQFRFPRLDAALADLLG